MKEQLNRLIASIVIAFCLALAPVQGADNKTILIVGDSISTAYRMNTAQGWVNLLQQRLGQYGFEYQVVNASVSGQLSATGRQQIAGHIQRYTPDIIIIELGGNDGLRGLELDELKANLQTMINASIRSGASVLLAGMKIPPNYGPRYTNGFTNVYYQLAEENNVKFIPFILKGVGGVPGMMQSDQIHPNVRAQPVILDNVWPWLYGML